MPGPAIRRSTSDPFLSSPKPSKTRFPASNRSTCSSSRSSSKSVYWLAWSNVSKLGRLVSIGRRSVDSSSKHSDLTEESLQAHNRRQQEVYENVYDKNAKCSPYYKGLTDYSLILNREKHQFLPHQSTSPGRESHATTSTTISSFVLVKMQEWSSCFSSFKSSSKDKQNNNNNNAHVQVLPRVLIQVEVPAPPLHDSPVPVPYFAPPSSTSGDNTIKIEPSTGKMPMKRKETDKELNTPETQSRAHTGVSSVVNEEKPLRERVSFESKSTVVSGREIDEAKEIDQMQLEAKNFTWADKYKPETLKDFICNRNIAARMQGLINGIDCNHFIFEGPTGVGKRTMIWAMLQEAFGPDSVQTREECKAFNLKGESIGSIDVRIKVSSQHIEVNLSDLKGYEKHVIVELIKETTNRKNVLSNHDTCRAIILYNADKLSADAVLYIKWLLERYKGSSKFFFCCSDVSKLHPIKELCTIVQLSLPSNEEIVEVLEFIARKEGIELPSQFAERIASESKNNLRQAVRSLEASWQRSYPFTEDQEILTGWEDDIANIGRDIIQEQSPKKLYIIRGKLQNLIEHDVSPLFIFSSLVNELKRHLDEFCQGQLDSLYTDYYRKDWNMLEGENQLSFPNSRHEVAGKRFQDPVKKKFHQFMKIEEFIAKFMSLYKLHQTATKSMEHEAASSSVP